MRPINNSSHLLLRGMVCCVLVLALSAQAAPLRVAVVVSEEGGAYREFATALHNHLSSQHVVKIGQSVEVTTDADLVIAVGMKAASAVAENRQPTLYVLVPRASFEKLARHPQRPTSAIYLEQPLSRQLALLEAVLPEVERIGLLYASPPSEFELLKKLAAAKQFSLFAQVVDSQNPLASALGDVLEDSEVLFVLPDTAVYNSETIRNILLETYRRQIPMIGLSPAYVRAGALCAVSSTPQQFARQTAEAIEEWSDSGKLPASQYPKEFEVTVNNQVARSLGLRIKDAAQLRGEIGRRE